MDVPRGKEVARRKRIKMIALIAVVVAAVPLITWGLSRLKPAAPSVDRATVWIDSVKRGPMLREVRGLGTLVVEEYNWIPAQFESRVEKLNFLPGAKLHPNDIIMVLKNPQMEQDVADLEAQIKQAQAVYDNLKVTLETARLAQEAITEQVQSDMNQAALQADRDKQLNKLDLKSDIDAQLSTAKWEDLKKRYDLSKKQLDINIESVKAQLENQKVAIANLNEKYKLKKEQVDELTIRAGVEGTLQQLGTTVLPLEQGLNRACVYSPGPFWRKSHSPIV
jgi:HlyD family secretion protein